jgi:hypothetical protein
MMMACQPSGQPSIVRLSLKQVSGNRDPRNSLTNNILVRAIDDGDKFPPYVKKVLLPRLSPRRHRHHEHVSTPPLVQKIFRKATELGQVPTWARPGLIVAALRERPRRESYLPDVSGGDCRRAKATLCKWNDLRKAQSSSEVDDAVSIRSARETKLRIGRQPHLKRLDDR